MSAIKPKQNEGSERLAVAEGFLISLYMILNFCKYKKDQKMRKKFNNEKLEKKLLTNPLQ